MIDAIGFLELNSIAKGLEAAAMLKRAQVDLIFARPGGPGKPPSARYCAAGSRNIAKPRPYRCRPTSLTRPENFWNGGS